MPHLIIKSPASVLITEATWCSVLVTRWLVKCTCKMEVAMLFLMLASITTMAVDKDEDDSMTILSSWSSWIWPFFSLLFKLKEKQSEKLSIILEPGKSSGWRGEKKEKILWDLLFESTKWLLMEAFWQSVRDLSDTGCWHIGELEEESMNVQMR